MKFLLFPGSRPRHAGCPHGPSGSDWSFAHARRSGLLCAIGRGATNGSEPIPHEENPHQLLVPTPVGVFLASLSGATGGCGRGEEVGPERFGLQTGGSSVPVDCRRSLRRPYLHLAESPPGCSVRRDSNANLSPLRSNFGPIADTYYYGGGRPPVRTGENGLRGCAPSRSYYRHRADARDQQP